MVYGTTSTFAPYPREEDNRLAELGEMTVLGGYSMIAMGSPAPFAVAWFATRKNLTSPFRALRGWLRRQFEPKSVTEAPQGLLPERFRRLPVHRDDIPEIILEVQRFKWIEAERHGRDIWSEMNPADPDQPATEEWFRQHFAKWCIGRKKNSKAVAA